MNESHEAYLDLCAAQAMDALDGDDRAKLEAHLEEGCSECEAALSAAAQALVALAATSPAATPRPQVKEALMARVSLEPQENAFPGLPDVPPPSRPPRVASWGLVWGLAGVGLFFVVLNLVNWQRGNTLLEERDAALAEAARLSRELSNTQRLVAVARRALLLPTPEGNQDLRGEGYFDPATGDAFLVFRHMTRPESRDFELWALHGPTPTSLGVLEIDAQGNSVVTLKGVAKAATLSAFAVSLEPTGGSPGQAPTGPVVLVGSIGS